ncbi:hypothetical protein LOK49_LG11G00653 [Camellia lanceoleosa]|uniref:Uncharacterized protein n=1 Tax=Camellia lanceoleosa TaxID=1840588 RepID=A0ACC0G5C9_9ERIC|nr:hypothetical protein LOK49_LG11G00653 [Camellia lanceoleosa]
MPNMVLEDESLAQLKLQVQGCVQNLPNVNDDQIMKDENPPIEAQCIQLERTMGETRETVVPYALESNESKRVVAEIELNIPLKAQDCNPWSPIKPKLMNSHQL